MKRLILATLLLGLGFASQAQVQDNAVIPVSVTINSVLRLQVNSGGNIQFVFNTMEQFESGIISSGNTTTKFSVSSSRKYDVELTTEDGELKGISTGAGANLGLIQYQASGKGANTNLTALSQNSATPLVSSTTPANNEPYEIKWEAGTGGVRATDLGPDTYITNVFLTLKANN